MGMQATISRKVRPHCVHGVWNAKISIVMNSLSNFANITLSSLYFDITKDCLYANDVQSVERRAVVTTLTRVSDLQ